MICVAWSGLTQYAVRCLRQFIKDYDGKVVVISEHTKFLAKNLDQDLGHPVIWVDANDPRTIVEVAGAMPDVFMVGGWGTPCFVRWTKEVKAAGGKTIVTPDEAWGVRSLKFDLLRILRYRLFFGKLFDKVFVCGAGGRKLFRYCGVKNQDVFEGLYAGDAAVFYDGAPLPMRPKKLIYVGQYVARKNVVTMCQAFIRIADKYPEWTLEMYGNGELESQLPKHPQIHVHGYVQTDQLGALYREAQIFILGSWHDNWGVVVHEAALSGCLLLLSNRVGAAADFATPQNAALFNPFSVEAFANAMDKLVSMSDAEKLAGQKVSLEKATHFSPAVFSQNLRKAIEELI